MRPRPRIISTRGWTWIAATLVTLAVWTAVALLARSL